MSFDYSLGRDAKIVMVDQTGRTIDLQYVQDFDSKPDTQDITVKGLDGKRNTFHAPEGWSGSFTTTRKNRNLDLFFAALETNWYEAGITTHVTIYVYMNEKDGSKTKYQFSDASLKFSDAGKLASDNKPVEMKVDFTAQRRLVV